MQRQQTVLVTTSLFTWTSSMGSSMTQVSLVELLAHCALKIALQATFFLTSALMQKSRAFSIVIYNPAVGLLKAHCIASAQVRKRSKALHKTTSSIHLFTILSVYGSSSISLHSNSVSISLSVVKMLTDHYRSSYIALRTPFN